MIEKFNQAMAQALPYIPNQQQALVTQALARFCLTPPFDMQGIGIEPVFILAGYAGTGKSSLVGALVQALKALNINTVLLAPTGRAAKVFAQYARQPAHTIHRKIYRHSLTGEKPGLQENLHNDTIYIVDEASMIPGDMQGDPLLTDLIHYVFSGTANKIIFLGDTAQLPPVGQTFSPAMEPGHLKSFGLRVSRATLTQTVRQTEGSGILHNATMLRRALYSGQVKTIPEITTRGFSDIDVTPPEDLPDDILAAYNRSGTEQTIVITRSNQRATAFNKAIRSEILLYESELTRGDRVLVAKNNYYFSRGVKGLDFIANGDIAIVDRIIGTQERYGLRFADVDLTLEHSQQTFQAKIVLDTLGSDSPALTGAQLTALRAAILQEALDSGAAFHAPALLRQNPYWNALQVKFAYALTCHKAQGGQWENVFVDMGYIHPEAAGVDLYRWLYTAMTRATGRLRIIE